MIGYLNNLGNWALRYFFLMMRHLIIDRIGPEDKMKIMWKCDTRSIGLDDNNIIGHGENRNDNFGTSGWGNTWTTILLW